MKLLTKPIEEQLRKNGIENDKRKNIDGSTLDFQPVLKLFGGCAGTWLITEIVPNEDEAEDGIMMFGLCDPGLGSPELGYVSFRELCSVRFPPFRLPIERDTHFKARKTLSQYADEAREKGRIIA